MTYIEALQELMNGKKIRHKNWDKDEYVHLVKGAICTDYRGIIELSICDLEDLIEDMWEIYQTEEEKLIQAGKRWELYNVCYSINCNACMQHKPQLYKSCKKLESEILLMTVLQKNRISNKEVDELYNALKDEEKEMIL